jgi:hypothetical protein
MKLAPQGSPKKKYRSPELRVYGDVGVITRTSGKGSYDVQPSSTSAGHHSTSKTGNG